MLKIACGQLTPGLFPAALDIDCLVARRLCRRGGHRTTRLEATLSSLRIIHIRSEGAETGDTDRVAIWPSFEATRFKRAASL